MMPFKVHSERGILPMKNSDMKIIAIILAIALFFTIITSNAVSIASVILLAKDATASADAGSGDAGTQAGGTSTTPAGSTSTTPAGSTSTTPAGSTSTTPAGSTSTTPAGSTSTDANKPADNAGATSDDPILADPLAAYQKATKAIHDNAVAGYTKKGWQSVEGELQLSAFNFLAGTLTDLIKGFMTEESAAEEKINEKGSDDAKNRMPAGDCSKDYIQSCTAEKSGDNYIIKIVMKDQVNPSYDDTDGLVRMSKEFLDIKDVVETVKTDETVSAIVKDISGTINYKAYTITATMNAKGEFVDITHYGVGDIQASVTVGPGTLDASGALSFNAKYYNFKY